MAYRRDRQIPAGRIGGAFRSIDDNKIRQDIGLQHGFYDIEKFPRMTTAQLDAD
jgi:hypothetical protein